MTDGSDRAANFPLSQRKPKIDAAQLSVRTEQPIAMKERKHQCGDVCGGKARTVEAQVARSEDAVFQIAELCPTGGRGLAGKMIAQA
jgi:hypothetical protein